MNYVTTVKLAVIPKKKGRKRDRRASLLSLCIFFIYRLHAEFNLSETQRERRQLERAMIVDARSLGMLLF